MLLLHLSSDPIQTWHKHLALILFLTEKAGFELIDVSLVLMTLSTLCYLFLTNTLPFSTPCNIPIESIDFSGVILICCWGCCNVDGVGEILVGLDKFPVGLDIFPVG